ncbi:MAG: efflux RND transporter periplasmic adaptor subunit, partial [Pyrinomonadaceae bacterium]|nr:efflux RND transporter periplasmic adaptor subunit [Pyrinomonadaceae bacterium]
MPAVKEMSDVGCRMSVGTDHPPRASFSSTLVNPQVMLARLSVFANIEGIARGSYRLLLIWTLAASVLFVAACGSKPKQAEGGSATSVAEAAEARPVEVTTATATANQVAAYLEATGSLAADEASDVAPETSGQVIETPVDIGAFVRQGTVIAKLDNRDARLRLQQARAGEQQTAAGLRQAEVRLGLGPNGRFDATSIPEARAAAAALESAEAAARLAETNARRYANLLETGDVARSVYDQSRTQAETARAQANSARQQYEAALNAARGNNQGIQTAQASLSSARSQVALAQKAVEDSVVRAPFSGFVSDRPVAAGEYVTPASRIATILRTNPLKLILQVPEAEAARVRTGAQVSTSVSSYAERQFAGRVTAINPAVDPTSRVLSVEVALENSQNLLRPGMFATARIQQPGGEQGIFVPRSAILTNTNTNSSSIYVI